MKVWFVDSLQLWIENIAQLRSIFKRELIMASSVREMKIGSTRVAVAGVILVGFLVVLAVFLCSPGVSCSKTGILPNKNLTESKNATYSKYSYAATSLLNTTKGSKKNQNAMDVQNEVTSTSNSTSKAGGAPVDDADFETEDYRSYDPTPSLKQPPHKLVPSRR